MSDRPLIMVVDDETKIRRLVIANLEASGFDTISASDGEQAIDVYSTATPHPDLVILDIMMPGIDGFECARRLRAIDDVPIIFLSARNEPAYKLLAFENGADDYVTKPFPMDELEARIRAILRRSDKTSDSPKWTHQLINGPILLDITKRTVQINNKPVHFADTEFRLLHELMKHPGIVITHDHLLRHIWGSEYIGELQYLRVAFTRIRRKFEEAGLEGGIISSYSKVGYILRDMQKDPL